MNNANHRYELNSIKIVIRKLSKEIDEIENEAIREMTKLRDENGVFRSYDAVCYLMHVKYIDLQNAFHTILKTEL